MAGKHRATRHKAGSPFLRLLAGTELRLMNDRVVPRPFNLQLGNPRLGFLLSRKALDRNEVILIADVGVGVERKMRRSGKGLLLVAHGRIDPFQGWRWHLGGETRLPDAS
jgi:hypothetical protein